MFRRGFTLLELTLVMLIAGVLVAIAVPRLVRVRDSASVRGALGELGAALSSARQEAITRRALVSVVIDQRAGAIDLRADGQSLLRRSLAVVYGVSLSANRDSVVYDPRGLGYGLSNLSVTVRRGGIVDTLSISRLGRVRW